MRVWDMLIVGGGPGGYAAALYAARAGLSALVMERLTAGGQMALTQQIDNYPGFEAGVDGFSLAERMRAQAERFGAETLLAEAVALDLHASPKIVESSEGRFYARTVVLATGAGPRELGLPMERALTGHGVHYCAACDGMFYKGKVVTVVGGGNTAAAEALLLSRIAKKVLLIHRRDALRADKVYHAPLTRAENVEFIWNSAVVGLLHGDRLTGLRLRDSTTGAESDIACDGAFVCIGRQPESALARGQLELDADGYIVAGESTQTGVPGVFSVGDVRTKPLRQIVTAVSDGATAVRFAQAFLAENGFSAP